MFALLSEFNVPDGLSSFSADAADVPDPFGGGLGSLRLSQACLRAALGVMRVVGSHSRHLLQIASDNIKDSPPTRKKKVHFT